MIAGQPPFQGELASDLFTAILNQEPDPLSRLAPETPAALEQIVKKALAKNTEDRYQKVGEMRARLQAFKETQEREKLGSSKLIWWIAGAAIAVCLLAAAFFIRNWLSPKPEWPIKPDQTSKSLVDKSIRSGEGITRASISPDGKWVAYSTSSEGKNIIRVHQTDGAAEWAVTDGNWRDLNPIWSNDGRKLIFTSDREGKRGIWWVPFAEQSQFSPSRPKPELFRELGEEGILIACDKGDGVIYIEIKNVNQGLDGSGY